MTVGRGQGRGRGRGRTNSSLECTYCNKQGHVKENCYELVGYPENFRGNKGKCSQDRKPNQSKNEAANRVDTSHQIAAPTFI